MDSTKRGTSPEPATLEEVLYGKQSASLRGFLQVLRRWLFLNLIIVVLCTGLVAGVSLLQTPMYEASIKILVRQDSESNTPASNLQSDVLGLQTLTQTIAETINSRPVAEAVIQQLGLPPSSEESFGEYLSVEQVKATQLIEVKYRDSDPERAQQIANTTGEVVSQQVSEVSPGTYDVTATVWERAKVPDKPTSPHLVLNVGVALVVGSMLGVALAFLSEYFERQPKFTKKTPTGEKKER
jgi:capsular polysaccharide biosynthesis protein